MKNVRIILLMVLFSLVFLLSSCESFSVYEKPGLGPPPHARARGLRDKHAQTVVIIESEK